MLKKRHKYVVWDWNGTLLDDVDIALICINMMLRKRNMKELDIEGYRRIFGFPVIDSYKMIGFTFNSHKEWDAVSNEFHHNYDSLVPKARLTRSAPEALDMMNKNGIRMSILSASELNSLEAIVSKHGIRNYFDKGCGLSNKYGDSKLQLGLKMMSDSGLKPDEVLYIGDTDHDFEVAKGIGCDCVLYRHGHQGEDRLSSCDCPKIDSFTEIVECA